LVLKAEILQTSLGALGDRVETKIAERAAAFRAELDAQTAGVSDRAEKGDIDAVMRVADLKVADEAMRFRGGVLALEQDNINEQLSQINAVKERLDAVLRIFPSPSALLSVSALGNPQRDSYLQQVAGAGHAELETFAKLAIATNNRALASAVASRVAAMERDKRPFAVHDFAARICGEEHRRYVLASKRANNALQAAINRQREVATGKGNSHSKLVAGLRNRDTGHYQAKNKVAEFTAPKKPVVRMTKGEPPAQPGGKETD
jgi:hypothetical protein